jgi:hypothetical protein
MTLNAPYVTGPSIDIVVATAYFDITCSCRKGSAERGRRYH